MSQKQMIKSKIKNANFKKLDMLATIIAKKNNKSKLYVKFDMLINFLIYGTGHTDYFKGDYINLTSYQKQTFVTTKTFYEVLKYLNNDKYLMLLRDKIIFNKIFSKYLGREFIDLNVTSLEGFEKFVRNKETFFAKVSNQYGGHGISKIIVKDIKNYEELYKKLKIKKQYLIEETIVQDKSMDVINPYAVNTVRIVTLLKNDKAYIVGNALRINQNNSQIVGSTNDLYCTLSEDGTISSNVLDDFGNMYETHPLTKIKFSDVKIKYIKEAFDMVKQAARELPQVRYIGWDVAISKKGPVIIEGNEYPSYGLIQYYLLNNSKEGHLKTIADVLKKEMNEIGL